MRTEHIKFYETLQETEKHNELTEDEELYIALLYATIKEPLTVIMSEVIGHKFYGVKDLVKYFMQNTKEEHILDIAIESTRVMMELITKDRNEEK